MSTSASTLFQTRIIALQNFCNDSVWINDLNLNLHSLKILMDDKISIRDL